MKDFYNMSSPGIINNIFGTRLLKHKSAKT